MCNHAQLYAVLGTELRASGMLSTLPTGLHAQLLGRFSFTKCCSLVHIVLQHWGTVKRTGRKLATATVEQQQMEYAGLLQWCMSPKPLSGKGLLEANEKARHLEAYAENLSLVHSTHTVDGKESTLQVFLQPPNIGQGMSTY